MPLVYTSIPPVSQSVSPPCLQSVSQSVSQSVIFSCVLLCLEREIEKSVGFGLCLSFFVLSEAGNGFSWPSWPWQVSFEAAEQPPRASAEAFSAAPAAFLEGVSRVARNV